MQALNIRLRASTVPRPSTRGVGRVAPRTYSRPNTLVCLAKKSKGDRGDGAMPEVSSEETPKEEDPISYITNEATKAAADAASDAKDVAEAVEDVEKDVADDAGAVADVSRDVEKDVAAEVGAVAEAARDVQKDVASDAMDVFEAAEEIVEGTKADLEDAAEGLLETAADTMASAATGMLSRDAAEDMGGVYMDTDFMSVEDLKAALLDSLYMTERGLAPNAEARAEIHELLTQLESKCPTPNPTENLEKMAGTWKLIYTSNSPLIAVLALGRLPLVTVGDITQTIDIDALTAESKVELSSPVSKTAISATASFEVRSPKRLQLSLEKGVIQTPELLTDVNIPDSLSLLGVPLDLTNLKGALEPLNEGMMGVLSQVNSFLQMTPELQVPLTASGSNTWQLNTYLDGDMRIARGDGGSVFLYVKEDPEVHDPPHVAPEVAEPVSHVSS